MPDRPPQLTGPVRGAMPVDRVPLPARDLISAIKMLHICSCPSTIDFEVWQGQEDRGRVESVRIGPGYLSISRQPKGRHHRHRRRGGGGIWIVALLVVAVAVVLVGKY